jgi:hypothetical protein
MEGTMRALVILLLLMGPVMAKNGQSAAGRAGVAIDESEAFLKTEEGRDLVRLFEDFQSGKKSMEEARDEYNKKWDGKPIEKGGRQALDAPYVKVK